MESNGHLNKMMSTLMSDMPLTKCAHCLAKLVLLARKVAEVRATERRIEKMGEYGLELDALREDRLSHLRDVDRSMKLFQDYLAKETEHIYSKYHKAFDFLEIDAIHTEERNGKQ